jgi:hypothetical protein
MPGRRRSGIGGVLIIAALLILALIFKKMWISAYVAPNADPHDLFAWFPGAAVLIVVGGVAIIRWHERTRGG